VLLFLIRRRWRRRVDDIPRCWIRGGLLWAVFGWEALAIWMECGHWYGIGLARRLAAGNALGRPLSLQGSRLEWRCGRLTVGLLTRSCHSAGIDVLRRLLSDRFS